MKRYDLKHVAYHALVAIYFIWFAVFAVLLVLALNNHYGALNMQLTKILLTLIFLNLFMGTALFLVIQQFRRRSVLSRLIFYSYFFMAAASVSVAIMIIP